MKIARNQHVTDVCDDILVLFSESLSHLKAGHGPYGHGTKIGGNEKLFK